MKRFLLALIIATTIALPSKNAHAMSPKGKAFLVICTYGTVGGALLGFATMAFGTNSRAIAQGASLGLYAGIAFGSYVISSHRKPGEENMDPAFNPEGQPPGGPGFEGEGGFGAPPPAGGFGGDDGYGEQPSNDGGGFFGTPQRYLEINEQYMYNFKLKDKKGRGFSPPIYINFINTSF